MKTIIMGATALALMAYPAFAQTSGSQNQSGTNLQNQSGASSQVQSGSQSSMNSGGLAAAQKIKQDLQGAGFTDVKVVAESFVVQAKSKDGDPVLMTIGPHGMSVFEAMGTSNGGSSSSSTTGQGSTNSSNTDSSTGSPSSTQK